MIELLKKYFGYNEFRPMQSDIIENVLKKGDSLVIMPTGGGKSICYQLPTLRFEGLTIVISPLISLMKDQVDSLRANGINAEYINSSLSFEEILSIQQKIQRKEIKLLYIAPERLALEEFRVFLSTLHVNLIAIDEAHCISEWGHDFRPEYRNLKSLRILFPEAPIIALTATATEKVREDILKQLSLKEPKVFISSFNRKNLNLIVLEKKKALEKIISMLKDYKDESVIIYCFSRKDSENIAERLRARGFDALPYHAGLDNETKKKNQDLFIKDKVNIIVATIAFGMGINKPDVRLIIHHTFPKTLEGYYQEIGRAGRDGLPSDCVLFYSRGDKRKHEFFIDKIEDEITKINARTKLNNVMHYCENKSCRRKQILKYFGEDLLEDNCGACDSCLGLSKPERIEQKTIIPKEKIKSREYDRKLFEKLRILRKEIAAQRNVPPFIIFGDVSLREMASSFPTNNEEFLDIKGVGQQKLKDFGEVFINEIKGYLEQKDKLSNLLPSLNKHTGERYLSKNYQKTKEMISKKLPISEIAKIEGFKERRIIYHIETLLDGKEEIDINYLLPLNEDYIAIKQAFESLGMERLSPIYEFFNGKFSYEQIRIVRAIIRSSIINCSEFKEKSNEDYHERLKKIKEDYSNAYEPWKEEDDIKLKNLNSENKTIYEIAQILMRQPSAIRSRLRKFGLLL